MVSLSLAAGTRTDVGDMWCSSQYTLLGCDQHRYEWSGSSIAWMLGSIHANSTVHTCTYRHVYLICNNITCRSHALTCPF